MREGDQGLMPGMQQILLKRQCFYMMFLQICCQQNYTKVKGGGLTSLAFRIQNTTKVVQCKLIACTVDNQVVWNFILAALHLVLLGSGTFSIVKNCLWECGVQPAKMYHGCDLCNGLKSCMIGSLSPLQCEWSRLCWNSNLKEFESF